MITALQKKAISAALNGEWDIALEANEALLKFSPSDLDVLNRLAKAHASLGDKTQALKYSKKVLAIDPYNTIAKKSVERWKKINLKDLPQGAMPANDLFLEEPGRTKMVSLVNIGSPGTMALLSPGDEVDLVCHEHKVSINTKQSRYIGRLPDDLAARIKKFTKKGNEYRTLVKSASEEEVVVFIRETKKVKSLADVVTFS